MNFGKFKNTYFEEHLQTALAKLTLNYLQRFELHTFPPIAFMKCFPRNYLLREKFGDFLVRIFPHSDQKNSELRHLTLAVITSSNVIGLFSCFLKFDWFPASESSMWFNGVHECETLSNNFK